ncbi:MAG: Y-family DNA polymerase [Burkholderiales bacterium]
MLWIALFIPDLPLQLSLRGVDEAGATVVTDGPSNRPIIAGVNPVAREHGVRVAMSLAAARALAGDLIAVARDRASEANALQNLAAWAYQFSPSVVLESDSLIVEIESALTLHGGLAQVLARMRQGASELGYRISLGVAPTPIAARLFARARHRGITARTCTDPSLLSERLFDLPLDLFDWPDDALGKLRALGVTRVGQCMALPRDGLVQRFGVLANDLDRAHGRIPDPRPYFRPPESFHSRIELGFEVSDASALQFPLRRVLRELEGYLRGRSAGVQQWQLVLECVNRITSRITFGTVSPERSADRLLHLARERLARTTLPTPALALSVIADQCFPLQDRNLAWLPNPQQQATQVDHLIDRLSARLGAEHVFTLRSVDDHRPEKSWCRTAPGTKERHKAIPLPPGPRPLWLLNRPRALLTEDGQPLCQGKLECIAGPERIEAGEWDGQPAGRDYYVARSPNGETVWVYREHRAPTWYLHGIFA